MRFDIYIDSKLKKTFRFNMEGTVWPADLSWEDLVKEKVKFVEGIAERIFTEVVPVYATSGTVTVFMCFSSKLNRGEIHT